MSRARSTYKRWAVIGVAIGLATGLGVSVAAASDSSPDPQRVQDASNLGAYAVNAGYGNAKDPLMAWMAQCLAAKGATYDAVTGYMYFGTGDDPAESKAMLACLDQLVAVGRSKAGR
jgi:hypothetical protein